MTEAPITPAPKPPLTRPREGGMISGVSAGLAQHFNNDPTLWRIGWVVLALFTGLGLPLYLVMWTVMPDADGKRNWIPIIVLVALFVLPFCCIFSSAPFMMLGNR